MNIQEQERIVQIVERAQPHMEADAQGFDGVVSFLDDYYLFNQGGKVEFFNPLLTGKPLTDLGCGTSVVMAEFAYKCGVPEYVGVDKYNIYHTREAPELVARIVSKNADRGTDFTIRYVRDDLLIYLSSLPPESTNLTFNGVNLDTRWEHSPFPVDEYKDELLRQIDRVVPEGGVVFGISSRFMEGLGKNNNFQLRKDEVLLGPKSGFFRGEPRGITCLMFQKRSPRS